MLTALYQSIFRPRAFINNPKGVLFVNKYGWVLIIIRWVYYSILFTFRDYDKRWKPFIPLPFGLDLDTYSFWQRNLALPFGLGLMFTLSIVLHSYLTSRKKMIPFHKLLNILGVTFFLPFVIVQPIDLLIIYTIGWKLIPVTILHTIIAVWESFAALSLLSRIYDLDRSETVVGTGLLVMVWIIITGIFWR